MRVRSLVVPAILGFLIACGSSDDQADTSGANQDTTDAASADAGSQSPKTDSIPMSVEITIPTVRESSGTINGGTFASRGNGAQCEHASNGAPGQMEWSVLYPGDSNQVAGVKLNVGRLENGKTGHFYVMVTAGTVEAAGMKSPIIHVIATAPPGPPQPGTMTSGSGTVTVTRDGPRVRFEVDGISGTTRKAFKMTLVCEREGQWV